MAALPRLRHRRVSRRLATAAGVVAGSTLIGSSLAGLNGSVLPFRAWPSSHDGGGAVPSLVLPAPKALPHAGGLLVPTTLPALTGTGIASSVARPVPAAAPAPSSVVLRPAHHGLRLVLGGTATPHAAVGPVTVTPAPAPAPAPAPTPAPAPVPAPQSAPVAKAPGLARGKGHNKQRAIVAASTGPIAGAPTQATLAAVNTSPGRAAHGKGLPPGQAKHLAAAAAAVPQAPAAPPTAQPAQAQAPAAAAAPAAAPQDVPPGHQPGHGHGDQ